MSDGARDENVHFAHSILESPGAIAAEAPIWNRIVGEAYDGNPFLSAEWFLLWLRHFTPADGRVTFLRIERRGKVAAYLPLLLVQERFHGFEVRALRFAANVYSPIQCPVIAPGAPFSVLEHVARRVLPELPWTVFHAHDLPLELTGPAELHAALLAAGNDSHFLPGEGNWIHVRRGETSEEFFAARDKSLRGKLKQAPARLAELGRVEIRLAAEDVTDDDIAAYLHVYRKSWKEPELSAAFHPDMMRWAAERGCLRLFLLHVDGAPIAAQLWLSQGRRAYAVKFAYDEEHSARSPGHALMASAIRRFFDVEDVALVDYLKGDDWYKTRWCNRRRQRMALLAFSRGARGRAAAFLDRELLPWVRSQARLTSVKQRMAAWLGRRR